VAIIIDTNVAIHIRDQDPIIVARAAELATEPAISIITIVELEGGVDRDRTTFGKRRRLLDEMIEAMTILPFGEKEAAHYGRIVAKSGFSRSRVIDRMIAAQAIAIGATLITMNGPDFRDIDDLQLEIWPSPHG
jgi:tRNA(fMet)-specific endonuclease VapC